MRRQPRPESLRDGDARLGLGNRRPGLPDHCPGIIEPLFRSPAFGKQLLYAPFINECLIQIGLRTSKICARRRFVRFASLFLPGKARVIRFELADPAPRLAESRVGLLDSQTEITVVELN